MTTTKLTERNSYNCYVCPNCIVNHEFNGEYGCSTYPKCTMDTNQKENLDQKTELPF